MYKKLLLLVSLLLGGCATVDRTIYLQSAEVNGPINHPPIFISDSNRNIKISPWLSFNSKTQLMGSAMVNSSGAYRLDTISGNSPYNQNNVTWNLPNVKGGIDLDLPISQKVSIFGSFHYSSQNLDKEVGGSFGFGFYSVNENGAIRFNIGGALQEFQYDASTVVVENVDPVFGKPYTNVTYYHDINKSSNFDYFGNITYNTVSQNMPFNLFFSLAWFTQTILDYKPESPDTRVYPFDYTVTTIDTRSETSTSFLSFSPGIYVNLNPNMRFVVGVNILKEIGDFSSDFGSLGSSLIIMPMAKIDLML
jgi:hypothetical protein